MSDTPVNPQAFPLVVGKPSDEHGMLNEGMSLRDYFAGKALQSGTPYNLASSYARQISADSMGRTELCHDKILELMAEHAYRFADAMLKAREL